MNYMYVEDIQFLFMFFTIPNFHIKICVLLFSILTYVHMHTKLWLCFS